MNFDCVGSLTKTPAFQAGDGGATPTPTLQLCEVTRPLVEELVSSHHYSGWLCGPRKLPGIFKAWGLQDSGRFVGAVVFSIPASYTLCKGVGGPQYSKSVLELSRLVVTSREKNAASFLVGNALRQLGKEGNYIVVSYADCNDHVQHVGYVYQATNWLYTGHGNAEPKWVNPNDGSVVSFTRRHIDEKAKKLGLEWTELTRIPQKGKHRYVTFVGTKGFKRTARADLRYEVFPYPKGTTMRHIRPEQLVV